MSEIDGLNHGYLGVIAGLPCYILHENSTSSFNKSKAGTILIGGGSGEHPALRLVNNNEAAVSYIESFADYVDGGANNNAEFNKAIEKIKNNKLIPNPCHYNELLEFMEWSMRDITEFYKELKKLRNPFKHRTLEFVLIESLGELIIFSLPHLLSPKVKKFIDSVKMHLSPAYCNVKIEPPGYPIFGGKKIIHYPGAESKVQWGASGYEKQ